MTVRSVTASALQRSTSSLLEAEKIKGPMAAAHAEETPSVHGLSPFCETESMAELTVRSVTALALQRSTSSLLEVGKTNGSIHYTGGAQRTSRRKGSEKAAQMPLAEAQKESTASKERIAAPRPMATATAQGPAERATGEEVEVPGNSTEQLTRAANVPQHLAEERFRDGAWLGIVQGRGEGNARGDETKQRVGGADFVDGTKSRRSGGDGDAGNQVITSGGAKETAGERKKCGSKEDHSDQYSSESFEEENASARKSSGSLTESSSDDLDGYQRRRANPQYAGTGIFLSIISAHSLSSPSRTLPPSSPPSSPLSSPSRQDPASNSRSSSEPELRDATVARDGIEPRVDVVAPRYRTGELSKPSSTTRARRGKTSSQGGTVTPPSTVPRISTASVVDTVTAKDSAGCPLGCISKTPPEGAVVGRTEFKRDVTSWFNDEVMVPSIATAVASAVDGGGERLSSRHSLTAHLTGGSAGAAAVSSFADSNGGISILTRHGSVNDDTDITAPVAGNQTDKTVTADMLKKNNSRYEHRQVHPARLFHFLWQRDRQVWGGGQSDEMHNQVLDSTYFSTVLLTELVGCRTGDQPTFWGARRHRTNPQSMGYLPAYP